MASLKRATRKTVTTGDGKQDTSTDGVLELSVTVSYLAADVSKAEIGKLERLLHDHCSAGLVAMERGDLEQHLHYQMVCRAKVKSARAFGILVRKYMGWYGLKAMNPVGKVMCKVLTNRLIHTWKGMLGYCLKDSGIDHFDVAMFNISDEDIVAGKTLHTIYGKADLKSRVVITNKNVGERAYVWFKYRETRQLTATFLSTLTDMIRSAAFIPAASWIIPFGGQGMDIRRVSSFWKCLTDPCNVEQADVAEVFIKKRDYVRGRYWYDEHPTGGGPKEDQYEFNISRPMKEEPVSSPSFTRVLPRCLHVPPFAGTPVARVKEEVIARNVDFNCDRRLFDEESYVAPPVRSVTFSDLGDFVPLNDIARLPLNVCLPSSNVAGLNATKKPVSDEEFWDSLTNNRSTVVAGLPMYNKSVPATNGECETVHFEPEVILLSSDSEDDESREKKRSRSAYSEEAARLLKLIEDLGGADAKPGDEGLVDVIELSSDSEEDVPKSVKCVSIFEDRRASLHAVPVYDRVGDVVQYEEVDIPAKRPWRVEDPCPY